MNWIRDNVILVVFALVILLQSFGLYVLQSQINRLVQDHEVVKERISTFDGFLDTYLRYMEQVKEILDEEAQEEKK